MKECNNHEARMNSTNVKKNNPGGERNSVMSGGSMRAEDVLFLTDHGDRDILSGSRINMKERISRWKVLRIVPQWISLGIALFCSGLFSKNVVYVTFGNQKSTYLLMALQKLMSVFWKPKPHIMFDCLWEGGDNIPRKIVVWLRANLVNSVGSKCIVYGKKDLETFHKVLRISSDKLVFVPYHHTLRGIGCDIASLQKHITDGNYVFSGGTAGREYGPLMHVCEELSLPLRIATLDVDIINRGKKNRLFDVRSTSPEVFRQWMAGSRLVVIPCGKDIPRTTGHQTFLNAMLMGKAVIFYNAAFADGYIRNDENGIVVEYGDIDALRAKIHELYNSKEERERIGRAARKWVGEMKLTQEEWVRRVYDLAACEVLKSNMESHR